jgi:F-type H+-transporting ATPase subunit b
MDETLRQLGELAFGAIPTIILFVLIWILYRLIVHNALIHALSERRSQTVGATEKARSDIAAADRKTAEYEQKLREARLAVFRSQETRREQVLEEKTMAVAEARAAAEAMIASARAQIQKESEIAKVRIEAESSNLAKEIIRSILRTGSESKQPALGGRA